MEQINLFHKGIVSGLDYSKVQNDQWIFPTKNVRIINQEGQGLIVTLLKGVEEAFRITPGYNVTSAMEYDGLFYIMSYNIIKRITEIGVYPSPKSYYIDNRGMVILTGDTGFEYAYKPLPNFVGTIISRDLESGRRKALRHEKLPDNKTAISMIAYYSYDDSVDLIIANGVIANIVINSGFDRDGVLNTRTMSDADFNGVLDQIKVSKSIPTAAVSEAVLSPLEPFNAGLSITMAFSQYLSPGPSTSIVWGMNSPQRVTMDKLLIPCVNYNIVSGNGQYIVPSMGKYQFSVKARIYAFGIDMGPVIPQAVFNLNLVKEYSGQKIILSTKQGRIDVQRVGKSFVDISIPLNGYDLETGSKIYVEIVPQSYELTNFTQERLAKYESEIDIDNTFWTLVTPISTIKKDITLSTGGSLLPGNYFLFIRYSTYDYNRTSFINNIGPISVYENVKVGEVEGGKYNIPTTKKLDVVLQDLDTSYEYFEIGVVRYFGEQGFIQNDIYLIGNRYSTAYAKITINGEEDQHTLTMAELLDSKGIEKTCSAHTIVANRYYGANWVGLNVDHTKLFELSKKIKLEYTLDERLIDVNVTQLEAGYGDNEAEATYYGNKGINNSMHMVGYHRGQTVPFGVRFILTDDTRTPAFPVTGYDCYNGSYENANDKGLFRFPFFSPSNDVLNDLNTVMGIKYDLSEFIAYINANLEDYTMVKGIIMVRADEIENLIYQGVAGHMSSGAVKATPGEFVVEKNNMLFPSANIDIPTLSFGNNDGYVDSVYETITGRFSNSVLYMYSPDVLFDQREKINQGRKYYLQVIGSTLKGDTTQINIDDVSAIPMAPTTYVKDIISFNVNPKPIQKVECMIVRRGDNPLFGAYKLYSRALPGDFLQAFPPAPPNSGQDHIVVQNRTMVSPAYVAINLEVDIDGPNYETTNYLVNILKDDPTNASYFETLLSNYNAVNNTYTQIADPIKVEALQAEEKAYGGNSFQTRIYFRQMHWEGLYDVNEPVGDSPMKYYAHGLLMGTLVESYCNPAYRHGDNENAYYPKVLLEKVMLDADLIKSNALQFIRNDSNNYIYESFFYNSGYSQSTIDSLMYGYDPSIPFFRKRYPTRIRPSAKHNDNSFMSGYLVFAPENYVDYDKTGGPITALESIDDELVSVQERRINRHFIDERALKTDEVDQSLIFGYGPILSPETQLLGEFGSQHSFGVRKCGDALYGIDVVSKILWTVVSRPNQLGRAVMSASNLSLAAMIESELKNIYTELSIVSNKVSKYPDRVIDYSGVSIGYDPQEKEVYFLFKKEDQIEGIVFSEKINAFIGRIDTNSAYYVYGRNEVYSYYNGAFYVHNRGTKTHDGSPIKIELSYIVNGLNEQENTSIYSKVYDSHSVEMPEVELETIEYETQYQKATLESFSDIRHTYAIPEYENGSWHIPIVHAKIATQEYQPESEMFGTWMKITLKSGENSDIFIRSIRNLFKLIKP